MYNVFIFADFFALNSEYFQELLQTSVFVGYGKIFLKSLTFKFALMFFFMLHFLQYNYPQDKFLCLRPELTQTQDFVF